MSQLTKEDILKLIKSYYRLMSYDGESVEDIFNYLDQIEKLKSELDNQKDVQK